MKETRRIFTNAFLSSSTGLLSSLVSLAFFAYAPRRLGVLLWGHLKSAGALVDLFSRFSDLGVSSVTIRKTARDPSSWESWLSDALSARLFLSVIAAAATALTALILGYPREIQVLIWILAASILPASLGTSLLLPFNGIERFHYCSLPPVLVNLLYVASKIEAVRRGQSVTVLVVLTFAQSCLLTLIGVFLIVRVLHGTLRRSSSRRILALLKEAWPFAAASLFANLYWNIDAVILQRMKGAEVVGLYSAAYTFANFGMRVCAGVGAALFPALSRRALKGEASLSKSLNFCVKAILWVGIPGAVATQILSRQIVDLVLGVEFADAWIPLSILIWSVFFILINTVLYNALYSVHKERLTTWLFGCMVLLNVALNLLFIPRYSYIASSVITVACEVINAGVCLWVLRKKVPIRIPALIEIVFLLLPTLGMAAILWTLRSGLGLFSAIPAGGVFALLSFITLRAFDPDERNALSELPGLGFLAKREKKIEQE